MSAGVYGMSARGDEVSAGADRVSDVRDEVSGIRYEVPAADDCVPATRNDLLGNWHTGSHALSGTTDAVPDSGNKMSAGGDGMSCR